MDTEEVRTCGEKVGTTEYSIHPRRKNPKYPYGIPFFSLWRVILEFTFDLIFNNARFK
jgi:hypothetical protein